MKKFLLSVLLFVAVFCVKQSAAQVTLLSDDFETPAAGSTGTWTGDYLGTLANYPYNAFYVQSACTPIAGTKSMHLTGITSASAASCSYQNINATNNPGYAALIYKQVDATGVTDVKVSYKWKGLGEAGADYGNLVYTTDLTGATGWTVVGSNLQGSATPVTETNVALPASLNNSQFLLGWRFIANATVQNQPGLAIDDVLVTATAPSAPMAVGTITATQMTGEVEKGSTNNRMMRILIPVTGTTGTLTLTNLTVTSGNTSNADITNVKLHAGTATDIIEMHGTPVTFSGNTATFSGLTSQLGFGNNYLWITYDIASGAPLGNTLDLSIEVGGITIVAGGGATSPGTQPASALNPTESRKVGYCQTSYPSDVEPITSVNFAGINNTSPATINGSPAQEDFTSITGAVTAGQTYPITVKGNTGGNYSDSIVVYIDWNRDGFFTGSNEKYRIGVLTNSTGADAIEVTGNIAVPTDAINGTTRMRILKKWLSATPPSVEACNPSGYGQTEDYSLTVSGGLPVTLYSFTGRTEGAVNLLQWTTATEINNRAFELQRSADGRNYTSIATIPSKAENGNSASQLTYQYTDTRPLSGTNFYRLKQIDFDGKFNYSDIVTLKSKATDIRISSVYPNPTRNELNLVIASPSSERVTIVVTDLTGKVILQRATQLVNGDTQESLNVQSLSAGTYMVKVVCANGCETAVQRFVKY